VLAVLERNGLASAIPSTPRPSNPNANANANANASISRPVFSLLSLFNIHSAKGSDASWSSYARTTDEEGKRRGGQKVGLSSSSPTLAK
jgi:hypothetical protein